MGQLLLGDNKSGYPSHLPSQLTGSRMGQLLLGDNKTGYPLIPFVA
jgi:hypothetical protein